MPAFMFAFVGGHLAGGGKGEATAGTDTVEVVGGFAVHTALVLAFLILVELLEAIFGIGIILDVVALVLLNVTLVLEGECAAWTPGTTEWTIKERDVIGCDGQYLCTDRMDGKHPRDSNALQWRNDNRVSQ